MRFLILGITLVALTTIVLAMYLVQGTTKSTAMQATSTAIGMPASAETWHRILRPTVECPFPCWWGIVPGKTTIEETRALLLSQFHNMRLFEGNNAIVIDWRLDLDDRHPTLSAFEPTLGNIPFFSWGVYAEPDELVTQIEMGVPISHHSVPPADAAYMLDYFEIVHLLAALGTPDTFNVSTASTREGNKISLILVHWQEWGFRAAYYFDSTVWTEESYNDTLPLSQSCFDIATLVQSSSISSIDFVFFAVGTEALIQDKVPFGLIFGDDVTQGTGLSHEAFAQLLVENDSCLPFDLAVK